MKQIATNLGLPNQYILTGSATPTEDPSLHSGVGRFAFVTMKPMTLYESGDSNGKISLKEILEGNREIDGIKTDLEYEKIAYVLFFYNHKRVHFLGKTLLFIQ